MTSTFQLLGPRLDETILSDEALAFVADLSARFGASIAALLAKRAEQKARIDAGEKLQFLPETAGIRDANWTVAPIPKDLVDRRVEITGPVDRKMIINALSSGANVFMADFEDSNSPTWSNVVEGQRNIFDAARRTITFDDPNTGKHYELADTIATLMVRPRGLHLLEKHLTVDGAPVRASLFDFGLCFFHNAKAQLERGTGPYYYLPKLESHLEARLWNDVLTHGEQTLGVPEGSVRATVLIETLPASFQMDEILWELRSHSAGLNCGRWDYIFSFIKKLSAHPEAVLPDRGEVTMEQPFLKAYTELLVKTCHRRGIHAMGGMAAQIPIKGDDAKNQAALDKVRKDKLREVSAGHDGTWVAHPGLVPIAKAIFDEHMPTPNQIGRQRDDVHTTAEDLLRVPQGSRTDAGLRHNLRVGVQYIEAWLRGSGCVPIYNLMEDAATAEISRAQVWQWMKHGVLLDDGAPLTAERFSKTLDEEMENVKAEVGEARFASGRFAEARELFERLSVAPSFEDFLTLPAYDLLLSLTDKS